ncbi:MAG: 16S rRNA (cytosine(967)-C(5))-methyltransferase RsmB [Blastocatellia bacterium]|nr:16S rRNA (cytosine(967)-C(5))-methyltransferase RsmB [Blastocatellia bacterium]
MSIANPKRGKPLASPARRAAFDILSRVEAEGAYSTLLIASLHESRLSREDRALAQEIILGVLRWQKSLDYFIERYSKRPVERLDRQVLIALRMGIYQLRHLTRIPPRAAVNESVNLVKSAGTRSAAGMVNAVLRKASRHLDERAGETIEDPMERAAVELSHPRWLIERWSAWLGEEESQRLALANNQPPPVAFRVNTLRSTADEVLSSLQSKNVTVRPSDLVPGAFVVERGGMDEVMKAVEGGLIYIQDEASQMVSLLLDVKRGHRVLDLCAAPGSKSSHIAALAGDDCWIMACDLHHHRLVTLMEICRRLNARSIDAVALDATRELPIIDSAKKFDRVLIDAPCSGTGTLRRNPEIKWRLAPEDVSRLAEVQLDLLTRAVDMLASEGRLVYSTCSIEREENEEVIEKFIKGGSPLRLIRPDRERNLYQERNLYARADLITEQRFVRTFPHRHTTDGFFAAVFEKV